MSSCFTLSRNKGERAGPFGLAQGKRTAEEAGMDNSLLMMDLMRTYYWFDESLRARLLQRGWGPVPRSQSLVLANVANGVTRASRIAENLGVSRQAMSQLLAEMAEKELIVMAPDPQDRRAQLVDFAPAGAAIREDAQQILRDLETEMEQAIGAPAMETLRSALGRFPGGH